MTYLNMPWEQGKTDKIHSPEGVVELRKNVKAGLMNKMIGRAESMFVYDGLPEEMNLMSLDTMPEYCLYQNGQVVWFKDTETDEVICLPLVYSGGINIYGKMTSWYPVPVGWNDTTSPGKNSTMDRIRNRKLSAKDSVVMRNNLMGTGDQAYIESMVNELVDNVLTLNQLQLISKCPFIFNVSERNLMSAKKYFLELSTDKPVIMTNEDGQDVSPVVVDTKVSIDPALFDLYDRWECEINSYLGYPCVPITKRAQQTVSEVESNDASLYTRRMEKFRMRQKSIERVNAMFGTSIVVHSVIDEMMEAEEAEEESESNGDISV